MLEIKDLLLVIDAYKKATDVPDTTISNRLFGDTKRLGMLRAGSDLYSARLNKAFRWLSNNWPAGGKWPGEVKRP